VESDDLRALRMQLSLAAGGGGKALPSGGGSGAAAGCPILNPSGTATPWCFADIKNGHGAHGGGAAVACERHQLGKATVPHRRQSFLETMQPRPKPCNRPPPQLSLSLTNLRGKAAPPLISTTITSGGAVAGPAAGQECGGGVQEGIFSGQQQGAAGTAAGGAAAAAENK
jgi:hypothetical protein